MSAVLSDTRPMQETTAGSMAAQRAINRVREDEDPDVLWPALLEIVDSFGQHSVAAAAFVRELGKRLQ